MYVAHLTEPGIGIMNEDCLLLDESAGLFGVFDGATSLLPYTSPQGQTGGYIAAHLAAAAFASGRGNA